MSDILFIKTSSLGDVIHHMPAVSDVRRHRPQARIGWVVEDAFAPLVALHRGVNSVIPVASRRWRRALFSPSTWHEIGAFRRAHPAVTVRVRSGQGARPSSTSNASRKLAITSRLVEKPRTMFTSCASIT